MRKHECRSERESFLCPCDCWSSTNVSAGRWNRWKHMSKIKKRKEKNKMILLQVWFWGAVGEICGLASHVSFQSGLQPVTPQIPLRNESKLHKDNRRSPSLGKRGYCDLESCDVDCHICGNDDAKCKIRPSCQRRAGVSFSHNTDN